MKLVPSSGPFVAALLCALAPAALAAPTGCVCFSRAEGPGAPNPQPIHLSGTQGGKRRKLVDLKGDAKACATVPAGKWTLEARSARAGASRKSADQNECKSAPLEIDVAQGASVNVFVSPLGGPAMMCGWELN
ncbi:MAG TPA: hypothetical protein VHK47_12520 [Polyangia bacterium]|jgi:hypothetical protein|nr:hypothetical protein [Polyangia bacterium]